MWAQGTGGPPTEEEYPEDTVRELFDENERLMDDDQRMAKAARDQDPGCHGKRVRLACPQPGVGLYLPIALLPIWFVGRWPSGALVVNNNLKITV